MLDQQKIRYYGVFDETYSLNDSELRLKSEKRSNQEKEEKTRELRNNNDMSYLEKAIKVK